MLYFGPAYCLSSFYPSYIVLVRDGRVHCASSFFAPPTLWVHSTLDSLRYTSRLIGNTVCHNRVKTYTQHHVLISYTGWGLPVLLHHHQGEGNRDYSDRKKAVRFCCKTCLEYYCVSRWAQDCVSLPSLQDDELVCFRDSKPGARHHFLVVPRSHLGNCSTLQREHIPLGKDFSAELQRVCRCCLLACQSQTYEHVTKTCLGNRLFIFFMLIINP